MGFDRYESRYGTEFLRGLWSEKAKRTRWHILWNNLLNALEYIGVLPADQDHTRVPVEYTQDDFDRAQREETNVGHDVVAELYAASSEGVGKAESWAHLGATSSDIVDNADASAIRASVQHIMLLMVQLAESLMLFCDEHAGSPVMGYTHWQPALPTTQGFRFALYLQGLMADLSPLARLGQSYPMKGFRGAVGTGASFDFLLSDKYVAQDSAARWVLYNQMQVSALSGHPMQSIVGQTPPRRNDLLVAHALSEICATLYKMCMDIRFLESVGQLTEMKAPGYVGSSTMTAKRNPVLAEQTCSLASRVASLTRDAWMHAATSGLERTLDDSAARRDLLPQLFMYTAQCLVNARIIVENLHTQDDDAQHEVWNNWRQVADEKVLLLACLNGANRKVVHSVLSSIPRRTTDRTDWIRTLENDPHVGVYVSGQDLINIALADPTKYVGFAEITTRQYLAEARGALRRIESNSTW